MTQVFVGNVSHQTSEGELRTAFEKYGKVSEVRMIHDRQTGKSRGFAFVAMPRWEDADEAVVRLNGSSLSGRRLVVNLAQSNKENPSRHQAASNLSGKGRENSSRADSLAFFDRL